MKVSFDQLPETAKVWMYISNTKLNDQHKAVITELAEVFLDQWESHSIPVQGNVDVLDDLFIRVSAFTDESSMCGRAQDAQVRFMKELEAELGIVLTDRMNLAFDIDDTPTLVKLSEVDTLVNDGAIAPDTLFYNNLILSKAEFDKNWKVSAKSTWLERYF